MGERERVELLRRIFEVSGDSSAWQVAIGDDAAVLSSLADSALVASVDVQVEGVHFDRRWLSFGDLGYRATMAALSDLAAMGARPSGVLSSLVLPADIDDAALAVIAGGQALACRSVGTAVVGGNLAAGEQLTITTTVLGSCERPLQRRGARPGDELQLAGSLGLAAAGLRALRSGEDGVAKTLQAWRRPRALIAEGRRAAAVAHAGIDISDGLALDAQRLAAAGDLSLVFDAEALVDETLAGAAEALDVDPHELALYGGEDYALLVAAAAGTALEGFATVGRCEAGPPSLWLERDGQREQLQPGGWDHFAT